MPEQEKRPTFLQPWVEGQGAPRPEEESVASSRANTNEEIIGASSYADLNQPQSPQTEAIPVTSEQTPVEPVAISNGSAPAVEPLNPTPVERQPETTSISPEEIREEKLLEQLETGLQEVQRILEELRELRHRPQ